jgi:hypothetical protein
LTDFKAKATALEKSQSDITDKELELTQLRNDRDTLSSDLKDLCIRARTGFKSYYGADSTQYEQAGGTRKSDRKKHSRKHAAATAGK